MRHQQDANAPEIVEALRKAGCGVWYIHGTVVRGVPDLLVARRGETFLLEVKLPEGPRGGKRGSDLDEHQQEFFRRWEGGKLAVVRSVEQALRAVGLIA